MKSKLLYTVVPALVLVVISSGKSAVAQERQEEIRTVTISKGDTIINGKQFSKISKAEKDKLRKEFQEMEKDMKIEVQEEGASAEKRAVTIIRRKPGTGSKEDKDAKVEKRIFREGVPEQKHVFRFEDDVIVKEFVDSLKPDDSLRRFHGRVIIPRDFSVAMPNAVPRIARPGMPIRGFSKNNSQHFNFHNTDKDGISTHVSINVSDAEAEKVKELTGKDRAELEVQDLAFVPMFSSGKISVIFSLPGKGNTDVKLYDNSKKLVFSEKAALNGTFTKAVSMTRNGVYHLVIGQGNNFAVKRIVKE